VAGWWASIAAIPFILGGVPAVLATATLLLLPLAAMSLRWRSLRHGLYSVVAWNVYALSFLPGFLRPRLSPTGWIDSSTLADGSRGWSPPQPPPTRHVDDARQRVEAAASEPQRAHGEVVSPYRQ